MKFGSLVLVAALVSGWGASARAQEAQPATSTSTLLGATLGLGGWKGAADSSARFGMNLQLSGQLTWRRVSLRAHPIDATIMLDGDATGRYYEDCFNNGQCRCRDSETGQFASSARCNPAETKFGAAVEAGYLLPTATRRIEFGAGYRAGYAATPYGTIALYTGGTGGTHAFTRLTVGSRFVNLNGGFMVKLRPDDSRGR